MKDKDKSAAARKLATLRHLSLTPEERSKIAAKASAARWAKYRAEKAALDKPAQA